MCFKKKKNVHHALLQAAWHFIQEDFSPPSSLGGSREGMRSLGIKSGNRANWFHCFLSWSWRREFRASLSCQILPQASWISNSISRIGRETLEGTQGLLNCHVWRQAVPTSELRDLESLRPPRALWKVWTRVAGIWSTCTFTWKPIHVSVSWAFLFRN